MCPLLALSVTGNMTLERPGGRINGVRRKCSGYELTPGHYACYRWRCSRSFNGVMTLNIPDGDEDPELFTLFFFFSASIEEEKVCSEGRKAQLNAPKSE
ncbi:Hypothetical predicted protein [Scomber scombrus]|uniref:Secreted protein n=1 Tax=Scomber scombrus TaxID=13677 RepID=A0AAV1N0K2_SCOSC